MGRPANCCSIVPVEESRLGQPSNTKTPVLSVQWLMVPGRQMARFIAVIAIEKITSAAVNHRGSFRIFGGLEGNANGRFRTEILEFNPESNEWEVLEEELELGRADHVVIPLPVTNEYCT